MDFAGEPLIARILKGLPKGEVIISGPEFEQNIRKITFVQENPPGGGPVAAIAAAMALVESPDVFLIATDMPFAGEIVNRLLVQNFSSNALIPVDALGKRQPLCARYKTRALLQALKILGDPNDKSMRSLLAELDKQELETIEELLVEDSMLSKLVDIDTKEDYEKIINDYGKELE
jgi:molybdopterin-guanine dinucleotide biosynthesis protein A